MPREFTKNLFIMVLSIMVGAVVITYFAADIVNRSKIETLTIEIETIEGKNINFTDHFMKSSVLLDAAREDRAFGNYHFDLAFLWYNSALSEKNSSTIELYKIRTIDNCTYAMSSYLNSRQNFKTAKSFFNDTKSYTSYEKYLDILDLYVGLSGSGARLTMLRYNASKYLKYMAENLSIDPVNISELMELFNETMGLYGEELETYDDYKDKIDEYEFFDEIR